MKLTKKLEAEILDIYQKYWDAYIKGNIRRMSSFIDDNCQVVGSAKGEVFFNKKQIIKYYTETAGQVAGKVDIRNKKIILQEKGSNVLVNEESDFYVLMDDKWTMYGEARLTTLFGKKNNKWKIIHQHGSLPDANTTEGEQLNIDKVKAENIRLKKAVKKRTAELEEKNQELEIEAALERVRASTMAMHHSKELSEVLSVLFEQFDILGINPVFAHLSLIDLENNTFTYRMTGRGGKRVLTEQVIDLNARDEWKGIVEGFKTGKLDDVTTLHFPKEALPQIWELFNETFSSLPKGAKVYPKDFPDGIYNTQGFCEFGYIGFNHSRPPTKEEKDIVIRFAKEFGRIYQRYLDIEKAEAQSRESEIELALERVRARAMAMQKSDELKESATVLYKELTSLQIGNLFNCGYVLVDEKNDLQHAWMTHFDGRIREAHTMPLQGDRIMNERYEEWKSKTKLFLQQVDGKQLKTHLAFVARLTNSVTNKDNVSPQFPDPVFFYCGNFSEGYLHVISREKLSKESELILSRFTNVFEQTYIRFLDLEKAEAQAREGKIQLALERVRSRTMAMHKSDELPETSHILFEQMNELGEPAEQLTIGIVREELNVIEISATLHGDTLKKVYNHSIDEPHMMNKVYKAWKSHQKTLIVELKGKELNAYNQYRNELTHTEMFPTNLADENRRIVYAAFFSKGMLALGTNEFRPPQSLQLLERFASVFDLTYTRFLDLQKAEAQARESQIQLSLERVRARSLAMQSSDELHEVLSVLFRQFDELGIQPVNVFLSLFDREERTLTYRASGKSGKRMPGKQVIEVDSMEVLTKLYDKWLNDNSNTVEVIYYPKEVLPQLFGIFAETFAAMPEEDRMGVDDYPDGGYSMAGYTPFGYLGYDHQREATEEEKEILSRFCIEFSRVYQRFLDIQRAEKQAREAQIEAALERVRSRSIAMRKSGEIAEIAAKIFGELRQLDLALNRVLIWTFNDDEKYSTWWSANPEVESTAESYRIDYNDNPVFINYLQAWQKREPVHLYFLAGETKDNWSDFIFEHTELSRLPEAVRKSMRDEGDLFTISVISDYGLMMTGSLEPLQEASIDIIQRFGRVFQQSYTRYLDVQKAEIQAREAEIELALERVRARTMAMHKSSELADVASILFEQIGELGIRVWTTGFNVWLDNDNAYQDWITSPKGGFIEPYKVDTTQFPVFMEVREAKQRGDEFFVQYVEGDMIEAMYRELSKFAPRQFEIMLHDGFEFPKHQYDHFVFGSSVSLMFITFDPMPEAHDIFKRFGKVFEQTYTRFLDLQKAEAQARESEIQLALERVRARTMAMHKSEELAETAAVLFQQMKELGVTPERLNICLIKEDTNVLEVWSTDQEGIKINHHFNASLDEPTTGQKVFQGWKEKKKSLIIDLSGDELNNWIRYVREVMGMTIKEELVKEHRIHTVAFFSHGVVLTTTPEPLPKESIRLLERFADVFNLTYRRFLDLQQAEAQVKESQIEAALERVRSKAMSMHSSDDLAQTVDTFFMELSGLQVIPRRCGVTLINESTRVAELTLTSSTKSGDRKRMTGNLTLAGHPVLDGVFENWKLQQEFHPVLKGNEIKEYYQAMNPEIEFPDFNEDESQYGYYFYFKEGGVFAWTDIELSENDLQIFRRYTSVLSLTYRRYMELQESEAREREAIKDSSLDRVRAEIASMRSTEDLQRITPLIWRELTTLNVPFFRCGVFIIDEQEKKVNVYLSAPDGHSLGVMHLDFTANELTANTVESWRKNEVYRAHWDKEAFTNWMKAMSEQGQITDTSTYQGSANAPESLDLHFIPFRQGMLYVGNSEPLENEKIEMVNSLAEAFAIAYARYEDFNRLEQAKQQIEKTLEDLKQAQSQLVQSEKMASLGELTAGIAHEIQNPLNFVNNFSEVSSELLEEMKSEMENKNIEDAMDIANDVIQNLHKILHHGKRADGIVKGMLQHSRSSAGIKEPTDINALADEYLRLAYHGLRAKDKTFNATMKTEFDESLQKVNVIPQDMGRVILNLITNAFYTVNEKMKSGADNYVPTVSVNTKKVDEKVLIIVQDNGNGIPQKVLDKIFHPFFTTKPTGQGTGLGLSLAYDIVKAHGGELKVETKENVGTEFIVILPV